MTEIKNKVEHWISKSITHGPMVIIIALMAGGLLMYTMSRFNKDITVVVDGVSSKLSTNRAKVGDALKALNISVERKDKVYPDLASTVKDDMTITIKKAVPVKIALDGKELEISSAEDTIADMLKAEGIVLNDLDKINPVIDTKISRGLDVKIVRVKEEVLTSLVKIPYHIVTQKDNNMEKGKSKVIQDGVDGEKEVTVKVTYEDGKEVFRVSVGEVVRKAPVNKIVALGTVSWFTPSRGGSRIMYTRRIRMKATSYTSNYACTGKNPGDRGFGITATGTRARRNPSGFSTVAVDPRVIPLGTKLYIEGYGYAIAEDTGGGVRSNIIDLYFEPGTKEFSRWYAHNVYVYVLK